MRGLFFSAVSVLFLSLNLPALAQQGLITSLQTGFQGPRQTSTCGVLSCPLNAVDSLFITLDDQPVINPLDPCKNKSGTYALNPEDSNVKVNEAVLLGAYLAGKPVNLTLNGCVFDMPRIVSVTVSR